MKCEPGEPSSSTKAEQPSGNEVAAAAAPETARWRLDKLAGTTAGIAAPEATAAPFEILPCEIQEVAEPEGREGYIVHFCEQKLKVSSSELGARSALLIAQLCLEHCKDGAIWDNIIHLREELTARF